MASVVIGKYEDRAEEECEGEEEEGGWEEWEADASFPEEDTLCLFCKCRFTSPSSVFRHCSDVHAFDFWRLREQLDLDFYDCMRFINFVRSQVASNTCWICGTVLESEGVLHEHLRNSTGSGERGEILGCACGGYNIHKTSAAYANLPWQDDKYLTPFLENDPLLYSLELEMDDDAEEHILSRDDIVAMLEENEVMRLMTKNGNDIEDLIRCVNDEVGVMTIDPLKETENGLSLSMNKRETVGWTDASSQKSDDVMLSKKKQKGNLKVSFAQIDVKERYSINQNYFGSYSTFGIHREMLSDKVRTEAYQHAIMRNPSLFEGVIVMDLGCGTGILSLFSAKAGARKVIAVEGSKRMAMIAQQVATANGYSKRHEAGNVTHEGKDVIDVIEGMVEELDLIRYGKVDVLVSEWMGYCLLFESMLSSVLYARDRWLKPGGAILPDIAKMYAAGFGIGGTSLPFWENVYGFDMTCIGKEVLNDAASSSIVDVIDCKEIVTDTSLLQVTILSMPFLLVQPPSYLEVIANVQRFVFQIFDIVTMADQDVDFTSSFELHPSATSAAVESKEEGPDSGTSRETEPGSVWCYGLVVWFDTHFSERFCKENPIVLSTSPYAPKTHWSQTLLTFEEPVCLSAAKKFQECKCEADVVGTAASPAGSLKGRISIARSSKHRSIDISLETLAVGKKGVSRRLPVQMFDL